MCLFLDVQCQNKCLQVSKSTAVEEREKSTAVELEDIEEYFTESGEKIRVFQQKRGKSTAVEEIEGYRSRRDGRVLQQKR